MALTDDRRRVRSMFLCSHCGWFDLVEAGVCLRCQEPTCLRCGQHAPQLLYNAVDDPAEVARMACQVCAQMDRDRAGDDDELH